MTKTEIEYEAEIKGLKAQYEGQVAGLKDQLAEITTRAHALEQDASEFAAFKRQKIEERVHAIKPDYDCSIYPEDKELEAFAFGLESSVVPEPDPAEVAHAAAAGAPTLGEPSGTKYEPPKSQKMKDVVANFYN